MILPPEIRGASLAYGSMVGSEISNVRTKSILIYAKLGNLV